MATTDTSDWVELEVFKDGEIAHDVTTAILAMDFEASLVDLSDGSICAGFGSVVDPDSPQAKAPFVVRPDGGAPIQLPHQPFPNFGYESTESPTSALKRRTSGGPWSLQVPALMQTELQEVLEVIIDERNDFEERIKERARANRRIMKFSAVAVGLILLAVILLRMLA